MIWIALILYLLPVITFLQDFEGYRQDARYLAPSDYKDHNGLIVAVAASMIVFWPIGMALSLIFRED